MNTSGPNQWGVFWGSAVTFELAWPEAALSPNARRRHWRHKEQPKNIRKHAARMTVLDALRGEPPPAWSGPLGLMVVLYPPDKRHRDLDNLLAACKADIDGAAEALGVDDHQIREVRLVLRDEPHPGGRAIFTLGRLR